MEEEEEEEGEGGDERGEGDYDGKEALEGE